MAVVIRLQGLRITAGSEDIRSFFTGLRIPDGGVHIIGGELEEAFIIFVSDEDARRAMSRSGGCIKGSPVNLLLSSKAEMQKVLEESTRKAEANNRRTYMEGVKRPPAAEGRPPPMNEDVRIDMRRVEPFPDSQNQMREDGVGLYLHLSGMPFTATQEDVRIFFKGLQVEDMIFLNNRYGMSNGITLVKFATSEEAREGLKLHRQYMGSRYICIKSCSEDQWVNAGGYILQPVALDQKRQAPVRERSRSPVRSRSRSPSDEEYCVLYENLAASVQKRDIKALLQPVFLKDDQIIVFNEHNRENTHSAVVLFRNLKDYCSGLAHHKEMFLNRVVYASPISKEKMVALLESSTHSRDGRRSSRSSERSQKSTHDNSEKRCLYVRNLPFDVRKVEIMDFFHGFQLSEDRIILLHDERGTGLGEVLIVFQTEEEATTAQSLNGQRFLGSQVILKCITLAQMQAFGINSKTVESSVQRNPGGHRDPSPLSHNQMREADRDVMPDRPYFGQGNNAQFDSFENTDVQGQGTHWSGPQQHPPSDQQPFNGPTCLKLLNLPAQIRDDEIYDFCYGYSVIPGSVSLQYDRKGSISSATVVFETHNEAVTAIEELNGRPIGRRKIKIVFV